MKKEEEIMTFLNERVFEPILTSNAPNKLKQGTRLTITRMSQLDALGMVKFYWSAIIGTDRSVEFAAMLREADFIRFEEVIDDFRARFTDEWLRK